MIWNQDMQIVFAFFVVFQIQEWACLSLCLNVTDTEHIGISEDYQESTEHVEADEVNNGEATAAGSLLSRVVVGLWITQLPWQTG